MGIVVLIGIWVWKGDINIGWSVIKLYWFFGIIQKNCDQEKQCIRLLGILFWFVLINSEMNKWCKCEWWQWEKS